MNRDKFEENYSVEKTKFPSACLEYDTNLKLFISEEEMNAIKEIPELKCPVNKKIEEFNV